MRFPISISFACILVLSQGNALDFDGDGLSDIWQQQFAAQNLTSAADSDGDRFSNAEEAAAGTNPFDTNDFPSIDCLSSTDGSIELQFLTQPGKWYQLEESSNLQSFAPLEPLFIGDGNRKNVGLENGVFKENKKQIVQEFWANIPGEQLSALHSSTRFPGYPDGTSTLERFEIPKAEAAGFGGRLQALITPPQSGDYLFFASSSGTALVRLSTHENPQNADSIVEIFSGQNDISENEWKRYPNQSSSPITLLAGQSYYLEVQYICPSPQSHCQIAWSGPGINGIAILDQESLVIPSVEKNLFPETLAFDHQYEDSVALWPGGSDIIPAPAGMTGNAEHLTADPGDYIAETIDLPSAITDQIYATWQFQIHPGHENLSYFFRGPNSSEDSLRVNLYTSSLGTVPNIRAGGSNGSDVRFDLEFDTTYRVELVGSLNTPLIYSAGFSAFSVAPDTYNMHVTDASGTLVGSATGLAFMDGGPDVSQSLTRLRMTNSGNINLTLDSFQFTDGFIPGQGYLDRNSEAMVFAQDPTRQFFRLAINDRDQDGDGLTDWEEQMLASHQPFLFFDAQTTEGTDDLAVATALLNGTTAPPELSLVGTDAAAFENNSPNIGPDNGSFLVTRTGPLTELTVELCVAPLMNTGSTATVCDGTCCSLIGSAGDEEAESNDYELRDEEGNLITESLHFAFGEMEKRITVIARPDAVNEYPETLNLAVAPSATNVYQISATNGASIQLFDLPDSPENESIFTGQYSQDGNAVTPTSASGSTFAILNGTRTKLLITTDFRDLTSAQQDAHVHKSNSGPAPGPIIYAITNEPGGESLPAPASDPKLGNLTSYPWDLTTSSGATPTSGGAATKQTIIDSLFGQDGETPLYFNLHTVNNPAGEAWSFLALTGGSVTDPGTPTPADLPGSASYPQLTGTALESEVSRFLNQATFGATQDDVFALVSQIETARQSNPAYHRHDAYENWIDTQISLPQTYLLDNALAADFQIFALNGFFDPATNPPDGETATPTRPSAWPTVDRTDPTPEHWNLSGQFPLNRYELGLGSNANDLKLSTSTSRRQAFYQAMLNGRDQLRQKLGFSLQQIVVVSTASNIVEQSPYAICNYQDMLNTYAFSHYRDVFGFVNWSPLMGKWLSSLQNQKGIDTDGDGLYDISPDENLARENMQLFSIGLFEIWPDGTLKLGPDGAPNNTYTNEDIQEFAKVLTGQSFSVAAGDTWGGMPYSAIATNTDFGTFSGNAFQYRAHYNYPMRMFGEYHDVSIKRFAGLTIDNTEILDPNLQGIADIEDALDWLAGSPGDGNPDFDMVNSHVSTPAFISLRLIQRFTTSNPSRDYLHRVATVFKDTEGDLTATVKAILLDPEARVPNIHHTVFGLKKSPLEAWLQMVRNLTATSQIPLEPFAPGTLPYSNAAGDYSNPDLYLSNFGYPAQQIANQRLNTRFTASSISTGAASLTMEPFAQLTVFNWYLPDYVPSGPISNAGLVAPEMQLANEQDTIRAINSLHALSRYASGSPGTPLGSVSDNQVAAFGGDDATRSHDNITLDIDTLVSEVYPDTAPLPTSTHSSELLGNIEMLDILDRRLTNGYLKLKYAYDPSDDDDPSVSGTDDLLRNPRELILDAITFGANDPWDGNNDAIDRKRRVEDAIYLLVTSPEFQVKK